MIKSKITSRSLSIVQRATKSSTLQQRCFRGVRQPRVAVAHKTSPAVRNAALLLSFTVGAGCMYHLGYPQTLHAEGVPAPAEIKFEEPRKKAGSREENRD